jgi:serine kinase of HPr protein (carbohydrate metabolism regulator)
VDGAAENLHGTVIALGACAAIIRGASGSGKSDLALRCLGLAPTALVPCPAQLVADDRAAVVRQGERLFVEAPATIRGKLEVRGLGIVDVPCAGRCELVLAADLTTPDRIERLPDPQPHTEIMGVRLRLIHIAPFEASAPLKLLMTLAQSFTKSAKAE